MMATVKTLEHLSALYSESVCHICRLPISPSIRDDHHPLVYTRDHVIPRARGGAVLGAGNVKPAHAICNRFKAQRLMEEIPIDKLITLQGTVWGVHAQYGIIIDKTFLREQQRIVLWEHTGFRHQQGLMQWADDGGPQRCNSAF